MSANPRLVHRFNADIERVSREGNRLTIDKKNWRPLAFTVATEAHGDAILALRDTGATRAELERLAGGTRAVDYYLERFARGRLLAWDLVDDAGALGRLESLANGYAPRLGAAPDGDLVLCRFAYLRWMEGEAVLESGLAPARLRLTPAGLAALSACLASPGPARGNALAETLWRLGFLDVAGREESEARRTWEFQDLMMHEASRSSRDAVAVGATYRFVGKFPAPPAIKPAMAGERIALPAVDVERVRQGSDPVDAVQARRLSIRSYSEQPIPLARLSEFLWRVCRTTKHIPDKRQDLLARGYPAGGSINELEFYVAVRRCDGLGPGVHHYDSHRHELVTLVGSDRIAAKIVDRSGQAMGLDAAAQKPDLTIVIASRLPRLAWKYEGMAYRASLMNAGVVFELMYLVATDMGLAPCANGSGDSRLLQQATGLDPFEEVAIAEFCLSLPAA